MGKGQGCIPSKAKKKEDLAPPSPPPHPPPPAAQHEGGKEEVVTESTSASRDIPIIEALVSASQQSSNVETPPSKKISVYIVYYSMYGHVEALAKKIKEGADSVEGVEGVLFQVPETLSPSVLEKMMAPPKDESVPIITAAQLPEADAIIFGFPTRYGAMAAQMKAFFDTTGQLWQGQKLAGKPAGLFVSTGTQGGGQETTAWTAITQLTHHGMLFVPIGYTFGSGMFTMEEIRGGSPYGSGTFAGDGSRKPSEAELALAEHQGKYTAGIVKKLLAS